MTLNQAFELALFLTQSPQHPTPVTQNICLAVIQKRRANKGYD